MPLLDQHRCCRGLGFLAMLELGQTEITVIW
jgi:hypothetical protein